MAPQQYCAKEIEKSKGGEFKTLSEHEDVCMLPSYSFFSGESYLAPVFSYYYDVCEEIIFHITINNKVVPTLMNHTKNGVDIKGKYPKINQSSEGYARSAKGLADWLWQQYGKPQIMPLDDFLAKQSTTLQGIFYENPYDGGTAHIDIVDNGKVGSGVYHAKEIWFWALDCK